MENYDTFVDDGEDLHVSDSSAPPRPFDSDGYSGFDPRLPSQRFESFHMPDEGIDGDAHGDLDFGAPPAQGSHHGFDDLASDTPTPPAYRSPFDDDLSAGGDSGSPFHQHFESAPLPGFPAADGFSQPIHSNGNGFGSHGDAFAHGEMDPVYAYSPPAAGGSLDGAVLPPPEEMQPEEGFILREWRRNNAIRLEEKSKNEREKLSQIIDAADAFKDEFYEKRKLNCETNKTNNREKEKVFLENLTSFHATADKHYWKAIAELVPHELPAVDSKSRGNKDKKKPSVVINHGPKPGKATDLTRMRQVLVKLKHNPPAHMKAPPPQPPTADDAGAKAPPAAVPVNPPVLEEVAA